MTVTSGEAVTSGEWLVTSQEKQSEEARPKLNQRDQKLADRLQNEGWQLRVYERPPGLYKPDGEGWWFVRWVPRATVERLMDAGVIPQASPASLVPVDNV